jgi:hypothetical protein
MAAPQVAAAAAMIKSIHSDWTPDQIRYTLRKSATDIGSAGFDNLTGYGLLNFNNALRNTYSTYVPLYRFWSAVNNGHFYTASSEERDYVMSHYSDREWHYEGVGYNAVDCAHPNSSPVYRFWSDQNRHHFYTISEQERDQVIAQYSDREWLYEGPAFCGLKYSEANSRAVYRFWSFQNRTHFYTASVEERDYVMSHYTDYQWHYEGIAYYIFN